MLTNLQAQCVPVCESNRDYQVQVPYFRVIIVKRKRKAGCLGDLRLGLRVDDMEVIM